MRIKFARIQVNRGFSDEDYFHNPGVHSFKIEREDGSGAWRDGPALAEYAVAIADAMRHFQAGECDEWPERPTLPPKATKKVT
jgi:hypothetical protein